MKNPSIFRNNYFSPEILGLTVVALAGTMWSFAMNDKLSNEARAGIAILIISLNVFIGCLIYIVKDLNRKFHNLNDELNNIVATRRSKNKLDILLKKYRVDYYCYWVTKDYDGKFCWMHGKYNLTDSSTIGKLFGYSQECTPNNKNISYELEGRLEDNQCLILFKRPTNNRREDISVIIYPNFTDHYDDGVTSGFGILETYSAVKIRAPFILAYKNILSECPTNCGSEIIGKINEKHNEYLWNTWEKWIRSDVYNYMPVKNE